MKFKAIFAAMLVAATLVPAVANAATINTSRSNIKHQSIIDPNDAAAVETCKALGGSVIPQGGKSICSIPGAK